MSDNNKKYIYLNKEKDYIKDIESIIDRLNFIVVESIEDLPLDSSEKYIILDDSQMKIPKGCKTILIGDDSAIIDTEIADAIIAPEHLKTPLGSHVFSRFLGENSSLNLEKIFTSNIHELGVMKLTSFGDFGYYSDIIYNFALKYNVNGLLARTYFIELGNLLVNFLPNNLDLLPIEIDYGVINEELFIQAQASGGPELISTLNNSKSKELSICLKKTSLLDIYSLEASQKIVFSAIWFSNEKLASSLLIKDRFNFDYIEDFADSQNIDYLKNKGEDEKSESNDFFNDLIHRVKGMSADDVSELVFGSNAKEDVEVVKGKFEDLGEDAIHVEGEPEDLGEDTILVEGEPENIDDTQTTVEGVTQHIKEEVVTVAGDDILEIKNQWNNNINEVLSEIEDIRINSKETGIKKEEVEKKVKEILSSKLSIEKNKIDKIGDELLKIDSPIENSKENDSVLSRKIEKLENMLEKKESHTAAMKRIMGDMQTKMIEMGNKLKKKNEDIIADKQKEETDISKDEASFLVEKSSDSQIQTLKNQNKELLGKVHTFVMDKAELEKKIKASQLKLDGLKTVEDVQKAKEEGLQKVSEIKRELHQKDGEIRAIDASKKEAQALAHTSELKARQLTHSLKVAREQFDKLKKKMQKSQSVAIGAGGNAQSTAQVKQIQLKHDKLQKENKKYQADLIMKKKEVIDMKKENTLMKNEVEQIKRKLMKYEKKAA